MFKYKLMMHVLALFPLGWLVYAAFNQQLGGDPQEAVLHELGLWALILLLTFLSMTPAKWLVRVVPWIRFRRMLGLYAAFYALLHVAVYFAFYLNFIFAELAVEIIKRPYIAIGSLAFVGLIPLVLTSTKSAQRRLGRNWKTLHRSAYVIVALAIIHFFWQSKSDLTEPIYYLIWGGTIMLFHVWRKLQQS